MEENIKKTNNLRPIEISNVNFNEVNCLNIGLYPLIKNKSLFFDFEGTKTAEFLFIKTFKLIFLRLLLEKRITIEKEYYKPKILFWQEKQRFLVKLIKDEKIEDKLSRVILSSIKIKGEIYLKDLIHKLLNHFLSNETSTSTYHLFITKYLSYYVEENDFLDIDDNLSFWKKLFNYKNIIILENELAHYSNCFMEFEKIYFQVEKSSLKYKYFNNEFEEIIKNKFREREGS